MSFLFAAYAIVLGSLASYAFWLRGRLSLVRRELAEGTQPQRQKTQHPRT